MKWSGSIWEIGMGLLGAVAIFALSTLFDGEVATSIKGIAATWLGLILGRQVESPKEAARRRGRFNGGHTVLLVLVLALAPTLHACNAGFAEVVTKVVDVAADILNVTNAVDTFLQEVAPAEVAAEAHKIAEKIRRNVALLSDTASSEELAVIVERLRPLYEELLALGAPYGVQPADLMAKRMGASAKGKVLAVPSVYGLMPPELDR